MSSDRPINGYKTIYLNTHSPSTAEEADADALPTYRVYEENTDTPILTGTMAKLDDANTLGQYVARIALTTGNGFEEGKEYAARMRALVETIPMNKTETFGIAASAVQSGSLLRGKIRARQIGGSARLDDPDRIDGVVGERPVYVFSLEDIDGKPADLTGKTLSADVSEYGEVDLLYEDETVVALGDLVGAVSWQPSVAYDHAFTGKLNIKVTSGSDIDIFPIAIYIEAQ